MQIKTFSVKILTIVVILLPAVIAVADPIDCIKAGVESVHVPLGVYTLTETLDIPSNVHIYCTPGTVFEAASGSFKGVNDSLITIKGLNNTIYDCKFTMRREEYTEENGYPISEYRHAISIEGAENTKLVGVTTENSGGDGVFVGPRITCLFSECRFPTKNLVIERLWSDSNRRTGLAIISCVDCTIRDSVFANTKGTSTNAGLIIEPSHGGDQLVNILVTRNIARKNAGSGFRVNMDQQNQFSKPISITFTDNVSELVPEGHYDWVINRYAWNLNLSKPLGFIKWDKNIRTNP